jgi:uncharacterized surface protein with fasciclin (FAS1) repeats
MNQLFAVALVLVLLVAGALPAAAQGEQDIVDTAVAAGNFTTLAQALEAAGLVETLKGEGPFTVFAPTNEAFAKLPAGTLESLLQDTDTLRSILTYHVVSGEVMAADVTGMSGQDVATVQGETVRVMVNGDQVMINDATVTQADVQASNGVIHVVDTVLIPPSVAAAMSNNTTQQAAPQTMPTTGADNSVPVLPALAIGMGFLLLAGAYVLRLRPQGR